MSPLDKKYWKSFKFKKGAFPTINCPTCDKGILAPIKGTFHEFETRWSRTAQNDPNNPYVGSEYKFSVMLQCKDLKCKEIVVCAGNASEGPEYEQLENGQWELVSQKEHIPVYFLPSLKIIPIKKNYPENLVRELTASFTHFFSDLTSCANKIRICIEILMDEFKVKKTYMMKGKRKHSTLHYRIQEYGKKNPEISNYLLAIKWIGNSGSHYDTLKVDDILDAYEIFDYCLNKIYDTYTKELKKITKEINKKKAPLSKKKKQTKRAT